MDWLRNIEKLFQKSYGFVNETMVLILPHREFTIGKEETTKRINGRKKETL